MAKWPKLNDGRKQFRDQLNQSGNKSGMYREGSSGPRSRLYGDYLYSQDRTAFEWEYEAWRQER